jgi:hypothetical protein
MVEIWISGRIGAAGGGNVGEPTMKVTVEGVWQPFERDAAIRIDAATDRFLVD